MSLVTRTLGLGCIEKVANVAMNLRGKEAQKRLFSAAHLIGYVSSGSSVELHATASASAALRQQRQCVANSECMYELLQDSSSDFYSSQVTWGRLL